MFDLSEQILVIDGIAVHDRRRDESARTPFGQILANEHGFPTYEVWRELPRPPICLKVDEDRDERGWTGACFELIEQFSEIGFSLLDVRL